MQVKYFFQKILALFLDNPVFPKGKTIGYSLVKSEKADSFLGECSKIYPPFFLHGVHLGEYSYIAKNSSINNCEIGNFCCGLGIHPTDGISTSPMFYSTSKQNGITLSEKNKVEESRLTHIGNDVFIGANVTVLDGVTIGDGAVIGAGAVVTKDIPPYAIAVGVPAIVKRFRFDDATISILLKKKWWDGGSDELSKVERHWQDVDWYCKD